MRELVVPCAWVSCHSLPESIAGDYQPSGGGPSGGKATNGEGDGPEACQVAMPDDVRKMDRGLVRRINS